MSEPTVQQPNRMYPSLKLHRHALVQHKLTLMRDHSCPTAKFRALAKELGMFLAFEATRYLPFETSETSDPVGIPGKSGLHDDKLIFVPVLRAGLVLAEGALEVMPAAHVGHMAFRRLNKSVEVVEHMVVLPDPSDRPIILLDASIGTGNTACSAIKILKNEGVDEARIQFGTILVTPDGMERIGRSYPNVVVHALSMEQGVDGRGHVIPGIGIASERLFGVRD